MSNTHPPASVERWALGVGRFLIITFNAQRSTFNVQLPIQKK